VYLQVLLLQHGEKDEIFSSSTPFLEEEIRKLSAIHETGFHSDLLTPNIKI
jgi:hypothetical protein